MTSAQASMDIVTNIDTSGYLNVSLDRPRMNGSCHDHVSEHRVFIQLEI